MVMEAQPLDPLSPEIVFVNSAFTSLTGYSKEGAVGQTPQVLYGPATDRDVLDTLRAHLTDGQPFRGETVLYRRDGTPYVSAWGVAPVRDETGAVSHWMVAQRNVTEQRSAEAVLRKQEDPTEALYTSLHPVLESTTPTEVATATTTLVTTVLNSSRAVVRHREGDTLTTLATANGTTAESVRLNSNHSAAQAFHSPASSWTMPGCIFPSGITACSPSKIPPLRRRSSFVPLKCWPPTPRQCSTGLRRPLPSDVPMTDVMLSGRRAGPC
jgi:PAS domain S-box-containing protein